MSKSIEINGVSVAVPANAVAYKYADPTEDARWIYDEFEANQIRSEDPSLIVMVACESAMFAVIDSENVIWGTGDSEESAMRDARHWLGLNHEDGSDVLGSMTAEPCTNGLAESVQANGGHVRWEWSGTLPRYMQIVSE